MATPTAHAHFRLNVNIRIVHVEHLDDGVRIYLRLPTPYMLASKLGDERDDGTREAAPYTYNRRENGQLSHYVDFEQLREDPMGLGKMVARGHLLTAKGQSIAAEVEQTRLHPNHRQPPFSTLEEAKAAFHGAPVLETQEVFVGDTVTDVMLRYRTGSALYRYRLSSTLDPGLPDQTQTANLILDHFPGGTQIFRATGLLAEPVAVTRSALAAARTFVVAGTRHIWEGRDHVLFVICLIVGATTIGSLLWRVTGFTVGHSITLVGGFFGYVPKSAWFVPAVEAGIALSIIYAAVVALTPKGERGSFAVTAAMGLLHGFGFSFVLQTLLQGHSPDVWQSLLAFNLGVEIGQVAIVLAVWPLLYLAEKYRPSLRSACRWLVAVPAIAIAGLWTGQRIVLLVSAI